MHLPSGPAPGGSPQISQPPHWYNREDKDLIRCIFVRLESLLELNRDVPRESRMIRQFVGSVLRRGIYCFDPFTDFCHITVCKDRTQGKEQDSFESELKMVLVRWNVAEALPEHVEERTEEPTLRCSLGRPASLPPTKASSRGGRLGGKPPTPCSPILVYPELLCLPRYPRLRPADIEYNAGQLITSASNKDRFCVRSKLSAEPSVITYMYASGMPPRAVSAEGLLYSTDDEIVLFPPHSIPHQDNTTTKSDDCPWRRSRSHEIGGDDEESDESDSDSGGPPEVHDEDDY